MSVWKTPAHDLQAAQTLALALVLLELDDDVLTIVELAEAIWPIDLRSSKT